MLKQWKSDSFLWSQMCVWTVISLHLKLLGTAVTLCWLLESSALSELEQITTVKSAVFLMIVIACVELEWEIHKIYTVRIVIYYLNDLQYWIYDIYDTFSWYPSNMEINKMHLSL